MKKMTRLTALLVALLMVGVLFAAAALAAATDTDIPATGTDIAKPTEAPAKKPSSSGSGSSTPAATEEPVEEAAELELDVEAFLAALGLDAEAVTVTDEATVIVLDEAEGTYGGSVLVYATGEIKALILASAYDAEVMAAFADWRAAIADVAALREAEGFAEFVKHAEEMLRAILPELTEDELDELLVAILNSDAEGVELEEDALALFFGKDEAGEESDEEAGEVLGVYEQDGYQFCLMQTGTSVILAMRAI